MYYIYHVKGVKIGVSYEPEKRVAKQGYSDYEILEEHTDIYEVSKRERELQRQYGYPVDTHPYYKMHEVGAKADKSNNGRKFTDKERALGHRNRRTMTYQQAEWVRYQYSRGTDFFGKKITLSRLSKVFGVTLQNIHRIINNEIYITP